MNDARIAQFAKLVETQPTNDLFRFSLAQALDQAGRADEAAPHYRHCVAAKSDWMMPRILLGKLLLRQGHPIDARPLLEDALQLAIAQDHEDPAMELQAILDDLA